MGDENVSGAEFGRFRADFQQYQGRMDDRLDRLQDTMTDHLSQGLGAITSELREMNGRGRKNSEAIAALSTEVTLVKEDVDLIRDRGCAKFAQHQATLLGGSTDDPPSFWTHKKAAAVGAGAVVGGGTLLYGLIELAKVAIEHFVH